MFSPTSSSDFFHTLAKKYLPTKQGPATPGAPAGLPVGGTPRYTGTYAQTMQQQGPFQGLQGGQMNGSSSPQVGGFANVPGDWRYWKQRLAGGTQIEAKQSSGDKYAHLTQDPFAQGPGGMF